MKKYFIILLALTLITTKNFAQGYHYKDIDYKGALTYSEIKNMLIADDYTISDERYSDLKKDETGSFWRTFYPGYEYIIVGISNDIEVNDIDLFCYDTDLQSYTYDNSDDDIAILHVTVNYTRKLKITIKNSGSDTPYNTSRCRFIVAYKAY